MKRIENWLEPWKITFCIQDIQALIAYSNVTVKKLKGRHQSWARDNILAARQHVRAFFYDIQKKIKCRCQTGGVTTFMATTQQFSAMFKHGHIGARVVARAQLRQTQLQGQDEIT